MLWKRGTPSIPAVLIVTLSALLLALGSITAYSQSGGGYDLTWSTVDGGGYTFSTGGLHPRGRLLGEGVGSRSDTASTCRWS